MSRSIRKSTWLRRLRPSYAKSSRRMRTTDSLPRGRSVDAAVAACSPCSYGPTGRAPLDWRERIGLRIPNPEFRILRPRPSGPPGDQPEMIPAGVAAPPTGAARRPTHSQLLSPRSRFISSMVTLVPPSRTGRRSWGSRVATASGLHAMSSPRRASGEAPYAMLTPSLDRASSAAKASGTPIMPASLQ